MSKKKRKEIEKRFRRAISNPNYRFPTGNFIISKKEKS